MAKRETAPTTANIVPMAISTGRRARYKKIEKTKTKMRENMHHHIKNY